MGGVRAGRPTAWRGVGRCARQLDGLGGCQEGVGGCPTGASGGVPDGWEGVGQAAGRAGGASGGVPDGLGVCRAGCPTVWEGVGRGARRLGGRPTARRASAGVPDGVGRVSGGAPDGLGGRTRTWEGFGVGRGARRPRRASSGVPDGLGGRRAGCPTAGRVSGRPPDGGVPRLGCVEGVGQAARQTGRMSGPTGWTAGSENLI